MALPACTVPALGASPYKGVPGIITINRTDAFPIQSELCPSINPGGSVLTNQDSACWTNQTLRIWGSHLQEDRSIKNHGWKLLSIETSSLMPLRATVQSILGFASPLPSTIPPAPLLIKTQDPRPSTLRSPLSPFRVGLYRLKGRESLGFVVECELKSHPFPLLVTNSLGLSLLGYDRGICNHPEASAGLQRLSSRQQGGVGVVHFDFCMKTIASGLSSHQDLSHL